MKKKILIILIFVISFASAHDLFVKHIVTDLQVTNIHMATQEIQPTHNMSETHHLLHFIAILDDSRTTYQTHHAICKISEISKHISTISHKAPLRPPIA